MYSRIHNNISSWYQMEERPHLEQCSTPQWLKFHVLLLKGVLHAHFISLCLCKLRKIFAKRISNLLYGTFHSLVYKMSFFSVPNLRFHLFKFWLHNVRFSRWEYRCRCMDHYLGLTVAGSFQILSILWFREDLRMVLEKP